MKWPSKEPRGLVVLNKTKEFERLLYVLQKSWAEHNEMDLEIHYMKDGWNRAYLAGLWYNTIKLEKWVEDFDRDTIFLDADLLCRGDMSKPFEHIKHVAYTENRAPKRILNAGVFYAKHTDYSQDFMLSWAEVNRAMLDDKRFHTIWRRKYQGINQAALGYMMENGWNIEKLPELYNLCHWTPGKFESARMIHVKSGLRTECLVSGNNYPKYQKLWRSYDSTRQAD